VSLLRRPLNLWLRLVEKPALRRGSPAVLRRRFEWVARLAFRGPRDVTAIRGQCGGVPVLRLVPPVSMPGPGGASGAGAALGAGVSGGGPSGGSPGGPGRGCLLYIHGGAFVFGSPETHRALLARIARDCGLPAVLPRYRLAPEHPHPAALEDLLAVYTVLAAEEGPVVLGGDSAGGALALMLLARVLHLGLPLPRAVFAFSPLTDLTFSGASLRSNATTEAVLPAERAPELARLYLQDRLPEAAALSPLSGEFAGAPPVWLCASDSEILHDDTRRMARHLAAQGVAVTERIEPGLPHVWPLFHDTLPEARRTLRALADWLSPPAPPSADS
jgi:acetyl esterase/lipase